MGGGFEIDVKATRLQFLRRQQGIHPDSVAGKSEVSNIFAIPMRNDRLTNVLHPARTRSGSTAVFTGEQSLQCSDRSSQSSKLSGRRLSVANVDAER